MIDLLSAPLPQVWEGRVIDPDYRLMIRLANAHARGETQQDPLAFAQQICQAFYKCPITTAQLPDAYAALLRFYAAGLPRRQEEDAAEAGVLAPLLTTLRTAATSLLRFSRRMVST